MKKLILKICAYLVLATPIFTFAVSNQLVFDIDGQTRFVLTNPAGDRMGSHGFDTYKEIESAEMNLLASDQTVVLYDVEPGQYKLDIVGFSYDRNFDMDITYQDANNVSGDVRLSGISRTDSINTWYVDVATTSSSTVNITSEQFTAPVVTSSYINNAVLLSWDTVASTTEYRVYKRAWDFPFYELLATTTDLSLETGDAWGSVIDEQQTIPSDWMYYRITSINTEGNESTLSNTVSNSDKDNDGFDDWRELNTFGTDPELADTDGDNLNDFLEINAYATDPNDPDTDGDSYTDGEEIEQGTNPTDDQSYPEPDTICPQDTEGNWLVTEDCIIDTDTEVIGNITIFSDALLSIQNTALLLIDLTQYYITIITGGTLEIEDGSGVSQ